MGISSKAVRYVLTPMMMILGAFGGYWVATNYLQFLANPGSGAGSPFWSWIKDFLALGGKPDLLTQAIMFATLVVIGLLLGMVSSVVIYKQVTRIRGGLQGASPQDKMAVGSGLLLGLLLAVLIIAAIAPKMPTGPRVVVALALMYLGVVAMMSVKEQLRWFFPGAAAIDASGAKALLQRPKILDTNVIIDGRIADVCRVGFVEGPIFIPRFVLEELQQIADSAESLKRARGRRGLDILNAMQKELQLEVKEYEESGIEEVDAKLVNLAQQLGGAIVTNDFNLNKVAELQGVPVLNVNELANALKPVVLPGEEMSVNVIKEGKEQSQGIGYLDDGTMVVVEGAKKRIGETLDVIVTSVLQTVAGKMIFATIKAAHEKEEEMIDRNVRNYSGGRPRKKIR